MGVVFALVFLALIFLGGVGPLVGGIVGLCVIRKKEMRRKGLVTGLLVTLLVFGALMTLLPVGFVGFVLLSNFRTDIIAESTNAAIEGAGYPGETFTADGVVYEMLPVYIDFEYCSDNSEPVFTYTWKDILGRDVPGNLFRAENPQNLDLIWDGCGMLYCPVDQVDEVMAYYSSMEDIRWAYIATTWADDWDSLDVSEAEFEPIQSLPEIWCSDVQWVEIPDDTTDLWINASIDDDIVGDMNFTVSLTETEAYLIRRQETMNIDEWVRYGIPLPDEFFPIFESMADNS